MKVGFIGLGAMGWPMASNLVAAGHEVSVHDADAERASSFAGEHAVRVMTRVQDDWDVDLLVTMLPTGEIVREVLLGNGGAGLGPGCVVIDMSSSEPQGTRELGSALEERGITLMDAPVSGGVIRATDGSLAIMVGYDATATLAKARPILECLGDRIFYVGRLGTGHAAKALNNFVTAAAYIATSEAVLMASKFGLDEETLIDVLNASTGRTFHSEITMKSQVLPKKFATGFALELAAKDVRIAADLSVSLGLDAAMCRLAAERLASASAQLGKGTDISAAINAWGTLP